MARLPKIEHATDAPAEPADDNPFALPVARNLGPTPGKDLFAVPPPPEMTRDIEPPAPVEPPAPAEPPAPVEPPQKSGLDVEAAQPPRPELALVKPVKVKEAPPKTAPKGASAGEAEAKAPAPRSPAVYLAVAAGAALGMLSIGAIYLALRSDPQAASPTGSSSPFGKRSSGDVTPKPVIDEPPQPNPRTVPAPAVPQVAEPPIPAPLPRVQTDTRPTATFALPARVKPVSPGPIIRSAPRAAPKKPAGPRWEFEGTVYDLLTTRGVFGAQLVFVDADDYEIASVATGKDGHYRVEMKAGPREGYGLRIVHVDYSGKHIDELDSTSSVRKADLEQRKFLMEAGARSLPWVGALGMTTRRDMALVPKLGE